MNTDSFIGSSIKLFSFLNILLITGCIEAIKLFIQQA